MIKEDGRILYTDDGGGTQNIGLLDEKKLTAEGLGRISEKRTMVIYWISGGAEY